ncbi:hypothetical protein HKD37_07G018274 [Glycine soja]
MAPSRFLWFTFGFASTYFVVLKNLRRKCHALAYHMERDFRILEDRLSKFEESSFSVPLPIDQVIVIARCSIVLMKKFRILGFAIRGRRCFWSSEMISTRFYGIYA